MGEHRERFKITRRVELDAGHRVHEHGSKCRNLHGHRYVVLASVSGPLAEKGSSTDMVVDFGFLKAMMTKVICDPMDHALILCNRDPLVLQWLAQGMLVRDAGWNIPDFDAAEHRNDTVLQGRFSDLQAPGDEAYVFHATSGKIVVLSVVPTAERLAQHWFYLLQRAITQASLAGPGGVWLESVTVQETPNSVAVYPAKP